LKIEGISFNTVACSKQGCHSCFNVKLPLKVTVKSQLNLS